MIAPPRTHLVARLAPFMVAASLCVACSSSPSTTAAGADSGPAQPPGSDAGGAAPDAAPDDAGPDGGGSSAQLPPTGQAAVEAWLATGQYKSWHCDPAMRPSRAPSKNVMTRICSNDVASAQGAGPAAVGAAAVEEVGDATGTLIAYAVQRKMTSGNTAGDWYWYGRFFDSTAPLADGLGSDPVAQSSCASCHQNAGGDAGFGQDFVFTKIP